MNGLRKLRQAILLVSDLSRDDPRFGSVKLNKILYYADFRAYRELGKSITGANYQNLEEGPAPREFLPARDQLLKEKAIKVESRPYFNQTQQRIVPLKKPDTAAFTDEERLILQDAIEFLRKYNGAEASRLSHEEWGWKLTDTGDGIPYRTAWLSSEPLTQDQIREGQRIWGKVSA